MNKNRKYFHCYATANDDKYYYRDIQNLIRIKNTYSGVNKIVLYIAISEVNKTTYLDRILVWAIKKLFHHHPFIDLKKIFFKSNVGRDFSSYSMMSNYIQEIATPNDYVFFQNRSGYGPFIEGWFSQMINQYEKYHDTSICGSTINFKDHPKRSQRNDLPHIQTYAFLMRNSFLKMMNKFFPGQNVISRLDIILKGEIGLSQYFLQNGYGITCMEWPEEFITNKSKAICNKDVKGEAKIDLPFYHRSFFNKEGNKDISPGFFRKINLFGSFLCRSTFHYITKGSPRIKFKN